MSDFRGRGRGRGRGGPPRGGGFRGRGSSLMDRDSSRGGGFRGRGYSRGRGSLSRSRDDLSPPRKAPLLSRNYDSLDRSRRHDRYEDSYDRAPSHRSRDLYSSPPRDSGRSFDRLSPPPRSRDRDYPSSSRHSYMGSRGDYLPSRGLTPPRDSGYSSSYKDSYSNGPRDDRHDSFSRSLRDYTSSRSGDYDRPPRDIHDSPRDYGSSRDYPSSRGSSYREPLGSRDFRGPSRNERTSARYYDDDDDMPSRASSQMDYRDHRDRSYSSRSRGSRFNDRGPPSRDFGGRGSSRGRGFIGGSRGRGGPPRSRGRIEFSGSRDRRSPLFSRDGPGGKRPRLDSSDGYRR